MGNIFSALVTTNYNTVYCGIYNCKGTCLPYFLLMDTSIRLFVSGRLYFLCCRVLFLKNMFVGDGFGYQVVDYNWRQFHSFLSYVYWFFFSFSQFLFHLKCPTQLVNRHRVEWVRLNPFLTGSDQLMRPFLRVFGSFVALNSTCEYLVYTFHQSVSIVELM